MNHVDNVIKRDVYPKKMHICSKNNSFCSRNIRGIIKKNIMGDIAWIFAKLIDKKKRYTTSSYFKLISIKISAKRNKLSSNRIFYWLIDCMVFNAVFNSISVISQEPVHLSTLSWISCHQYSAQYSFHWLLPHNHCRNNGQQ